MTHPLDNVIWRALTTRQAQFGQRNGDAARFHNDVSILGGFSSPSTEGYEALSGLLGSEDRVGLFLDETPQPFGGWRVISSVPLQQMVYGDDGLPQPDCADFIQLGESDVPEMLALTELTKPGPFGRRTREIGDYWGIRENGQLIAMAGERLRVPGYTEVSAVCTHPAHLGQGHATRLISLLLDKIRTRGERAFLHVRPENQRAVQLYERFGFETRVLLQYAILAKPR